FLLHYPTTSIPPSSIISSFSSLCSQGLDVGRLVGSNISCPPPSSCVSFISSGPCLASLPSSDDVNLYPNMRERGGGTGTKVLGLKVTACGGGTFIGVVFDHCWSDLCGVVGILGCIMGGIRGEVRGVVRGGRGRQAGLDFGGGGEGGGKREGVRNRKSNGGGKRGSHEVATIAYVVGEDSLVRMREASGAGTRHMGLFAHVVETLRSSGLEVRTASVSINMRPRTTCLRGGAREKGGDDPGGETGGAIYVGNATLIASCDLSSCATGSDISGAISGAVSRGRGTMGLVPKTEKPEDVHFTAWTHAFEGEDLANVRGGEQPDVEVGPVGGRTAEFIARGTGKCNVTVLGVRGGGLKVMVRGGREVLKKFEERTR
ncbi:hypothetical protein TrRE_jg12817, partial [Triparma retinervis]